MAYVRNGSTGKLAVFSNGALVGEASYNGNISSTKRKKLVVIHCVVACLTDIFLVSELLKDKHYMIKTLPYTYVSDNYK